MAPESFRGLNFAMEDRQELEVTNVANEDVPPRSHQACGLLQDYVQVFDAGKYSARPN